MTASWKLSWHYVIAALLIGFFSGMVFGQWRVRHDFHHSWKHGKMKQQMLERFAAELHLTADQKAQAAKIFEDRHPQMLALHEEMRPKFEALRNATQEEIRKILTPDQQKKLDEMNARREERWKKRGEFSKD